MQLGESNKRRRKTGDLGHPFGVGTEESLLAKFQILPAPFVHWVRPASRKR